MRSKTDPICTCHLHDDRSIALWTTQKKKPIFTQALAHGLDESHVDTEDMPTIRKPRWVTAIGALPYSDLFASGPSPTAIDHTLTY